MRKCLPSISKGSAAVIFLTLHKAILPSSCKWSRQEGWGAAQDFCQEVWNSCHQLVFIWRYCYLWISYFAPLWLHLNNYNNTLAKSLMLFFKILYLFEMPACAGWFRSIWHNLEFPGEREPQQGNYLHQISLGAKSVRQHLVKDWCGRIQPMRGATLGMKESKQSQPCNASWRAVFPLSRTLFQFLPWGLILVFLDGGL